MGLDRGRQEYRITVAGTEMMLIPGLTGGGDVDCGAFATQCSRSQAG
jgi:hypothetical protein